MKEKFVDFPFLDGVPEISIETEDSLIMLIDLIKNLDEKEYEFVMKNTMRLKDVGK